MVNRLVFGRIKQGNPRMIMHKIDQFIDSLCVLAIGELLLITIRELLKTPWIMVPPRSQIRAWRNLFEPVVQFGALDRKSTRLNSSHVSISYAVFCLKKKKE